MKTNKIISLSLTALLALGFCACSDDDTDKTPLSDPSAAVASSSASSLTFSWNKVEGARQYGCELKDASGEVIDAQVVDATEVTFTGLRPSTTYTLDVTAYASVDGDKGNSKAFTLTGTTADATKLAEPVLNYTLEAGYANVYWDEVEGATEYAYTYSQNGTVESGTTTNTYFYIPTIPYAEYAVSVYATSSDPSYQNSDTARLSFTMWRDEAWSATGTYTSFHLGESFESAVVAYSDNTYSILAFYGVEGYNFDFSVNGGVIQPLSSYETDSNGDYMIPTGRTDFPTILVSTAYGKQSTFSGNEREGSIRIVTCNYPEGADTFEWAPEADELWRSDGVYYSAVTGQNYDATIVANSDGTYTILHYMGVEGYNLTFYVDGSNFIFVDYYSYDEANYWYLLLTGLEDPAYIYLYPWNGYCSMTGDSTSGAVYFYVYGATDWTSDIFLWGSAAEEKPTMNPRGRNPLIKR